MCVVSMIGDYYQDKWKDLYPKPSITPDVPLSPASPGTGVPMRTIEEWAEILNPPAKKSDLDALRKEVEEMKALLKRAIKYDEKNNEPHCEIEEKVALLKAVAKMVGVDLSEVFGNG